MSRFVHTDKMCGWMRKHYLLPLPELTDAFNQAFNVSRTKEEMNGFRKRLKLKTGRSGTFPKGNVPANKGKKGLKGANSGSFKKNNIPHNYQPIGTEVITTDGYIKVKIGHPRKWKHKHILVWEEHNGPVPKGHIIKFIDCNPLNCSIDNLMAITRSEHGVINRFFSGAPPEYKDAVLQLARIKIAIRGIETKRQDQC
ncbi:HNH endonuclease signature motif containing protein [Providencia sp. PROV039]|uniref:HNH endonuclease signature motif containing protein n=1 Tax=Providencia sp. PROV039 TaxID=2949770 RepID=UPI002348F9EE|nr:HNH endonuclease signature motif containing protein [Providencia sp. PROV039]